MKTYDPVVLEVFRRAYKEAKPSADYAVLVENGETAKEGWSNKYYLPLERLETIFDDVCKERNIDATDRIRFSFDVFGEDSPNSI